MANVSIELSIIRKRLYIQRVGNRKYKEKMNIQGIIFDLDGTLADTEPLHMEAWLDVLAQQNLLFDEHWFEQWIGSSDRYLAENVVAEYKLKALPKELQKLKSATYQDMAAKKAQLYPDVEKGLEALRRHYKLGIATNSSRADATAVFASTKVNTYFQAVVTASDVEQLKPVPDVFLLAANRIELNPANGLAIEDSVAGIKAAKKAGLYTLAVANSHAVDMLGEADQVFPNTGQALAWILNIP